MKRLSTSILFILAAVVLAASPAHANVGTPVIILGGLHLMFGNFIIGIFEAGIILMLFFKEEEKPVFVAFLTMILANYFSFIVGYVLLFSIFEDRLYGDANIYNARIILFLSVIVCYILTIFFEWPFVYRILRKKSKPVKTTLKASFIVQSLSYAALIVLYLFANNTSILTKAHITKSLSFVKPIKGHVYFISKEDGDIYKIRPDGTDKRLVVKADIKQYDSRLVALPAKGGNGADLYVTDYPEEEKLALLISNAAHSAIYMESGPPLNNTHLNIGDAAGGEFGKTPHVSTYYSSIYIDMENGEHYQLALETNFFHPLATNATVLPTKQVIYQLGEQILILDVKTRKLALLTMGRGPVFLYDE